MDYMERAIELAKKGCGAVNPNPMVGAVIVKNGKIIGEGYHKRYGDLHAERSAFANLENPEDAKGAEMYVTLEPCCHYGKQPPCTEAIIEHGIKKVYVGSDDPNPLVAGKGMRILKEAGIEVVSHYNKKKCDELNAVFFHYISKKTPYVVAKYAMTMDGRIATDSGKSQWITGEAARNHVQETRNWLMGIMVGVNTILADDPRLTCRIEGGRNPIRIICDSHLRIPLDSIVVNTAKSQRTIVATLENHDIEKGRCLQEKGVEIVTCKEQDGRIDLSDLMITLGAMKIDSILLEGGATLNESAFRQNIVNEVQVYVAPKIFGGSGKYVPVRGSGVDSPDEAYLFALERVDQYEDDILLTYRIKENER